MTELGAPGDALIIRQEASGDASAIRRVNVRAFGQPEEAALIEALRRRDAFTLSLVALLGDQVVGHILFTPVKIESADSTFEALGLGPMAVLTHYQRKGIGSRLVQAGLEECQRAGHEVVVPVGHPEYYPRFGFFPARRFGIRYEEKVPEEAFMLVELREGALAGRAES
jgi:putative acetyltransferase